MTQEALAASAVKEVASKGRASVVNRRNPGGVPKSSAGELGVHGVGEIVLLEATELIVHADPVVFDRLHLRHLLM